MRGWTKGVSNANGGTNFSNIASVAYNPSSYPTKDGTGGTLTSLAVSNLTNVRFLTWTFSASQQNGGVGYTELAAFGKPSVQPVPATLSASSLPGLPNLIMNLSGLSPGGSYVLQSTTNLAVATWATETNFIATQAVAAFTNSTASVAQKFYRLVGN